MSLHKRLRARRWNRYMFKFTIISIIIGVILVALSNTYFDLSFGRDVITPTSIDRDMWGNYKIHFDTDYSNDRPEGFYYIERERPWLITKVQEAINSNKDIVIHYDAYIGYKGIMAPRTSPIITVSIIDPMDHDKYKVKIKRGSDDYETGIHIWSEISSCAWRFYETCRETILLVWGKWKP